LPPLRRLGRSPLERPRPGAAASEVDWPIFGRVLERTHYIAEAPDPPFHYTGFQTVWAFDAKRSGSGG